MLGRMRRTFGRARTAHTAHNPRGLGEAHGACARRATRARYGLPEVAVAPAPKVSDRSSEAVRLHNGVLALAPDHNEREDAFRTGRTPSRSLCRNAARKNACGCTSRQHRLAACAKMAGHTSDKDACTRIHTPRSLMQWKEAQCIIVGNLRSPASSSGDGGDGGEGELKASLDCVGLSAVATGAGKLFERLGIFAPRRSAMLSNESRVSSVVHTQLPGRSPALDFPERCCGGNGSRCQNV